MELFGDDQIMYRYVFKHFSPASAGANFPFISCKLTINYNLLVFISVATHTYDQFYFVGPTTFNYTHSDEDVAQIVSTAFTNFAKYRRVQSLFFQSNPLYSSVIRTVMELRLIFPLNGYQQQTLNHRSTSSSRLNHGWVTNSSMEDRISTMFSIRSLALSMLFNFQVI